LEDLLIQNFFLDSYKRFRRTIILELKKFINLKANKKGKYLISILAMLLLGFILNILSDNIRDPQNYNKPNNNIIRSSGTLTPKGIRLTVVNDSSNSMIITWYTENEALDPEVVYSDQYSLINNKTAIPSLKTIEGYYIYSANLIDLEPRNMYFYQVSSDSSNKREILNFTTQPNRDANSLKFLVYGDSRSQRDPRQELVKKIVENFNDLDFLLHAGDIINNGLNQIEWNTYFDDTEILNKKVHGYYIEGNHEKLNGSLYDNLPLPTDGENSYFYSFNIGPASFIGLNTERDHLVQTDWLDTTLNNSFRDDYTQWTFAFMHQPIFSSRSSRPDRTDLISNWCPLFEKYNTDLIFQGHNHYYERSFPMNRHKEYNDSSKLIFKNPSNPMYIITGGAGAPLRNRDMHPAYSAYYNSTFHFIVININNIPEDNKTIMTLETWAMPNTYENLYLIDNITIVKDYYPLVIENGNKRFQIYGFEPKILVTFFLLINIISVIYVTNKVKRG
jgi:hypothetical protein